MITYPYKALLLEDSGLHARFLEQTKDLLREHGDVFLLVERAVSSDLLIFYKGSIHSAARLTRDAVAPLSVASFFVDWRRNPMGQARLFEAERACLLVMAVVLQNKASVKVTSKLAGIEPILNNLQARGKSAAIQLSHGDERNLVYFHDGVPIAMFFADRKNCLPGRSVRDQLVAYGERMPEDTTIESFHSLESRFDAQAAMPFDALVEGRTGPMPFFLRIMHKSEVITRRLIRTGAATIGRDSANDIVIDDRSVSRRHCAIAWVGSHHVITDKDSANGILVNGKKLAAARLSFGDRITVGDFELIFAEHDDNLWEDELRTLFVGPATKGPGAAVKAVESTAQVMFHGMPITIEGSVFTMGKGTASTLRIKALRMRPVQASIVHEALDKYRLVAARGGRAVSVNKTRVDGTGVVLSSGDHIRVASHELRFVLNAGPELPVA